MPRPYNRRHVDADFTGHDPHRRDPESTPNIIITEETQRNLVALAENQRALSTIAASVGSLGALGASPLSGYAPNATNHPELMKINDQRPPLGLQMGVPGIPIFDGVINDPAEYNRDFYWRDGVAKYDEMYRSDAQVRQATAVMARPIRRAKWDIQPVSDAKVDIEIASAVKSALFDDMCYYTSDGEEIIQTWDDILRHLLLMFVYGFSTMEYVWRKDKDGWTKWANWAPILPRTVWRWWTGGAGELLGIQQYAYKDGLFQLIEIPAKKLLRVAYDQQGNNYDGISPLRSSYPNWFYKQQYLAIESVGIERTAIPMPIIHLPPTASAADYDRAKQIAQNIRANEKMHIVIPADWTVEYLQGQANDTQISSAVEFHDKQIARNVGAMFLNLGGQRGAMNLDKSQTQTFMQAIQAEADYIAEQISASAIRKFVKANYDGVKVYPKLFCSKISTQDIETLSKSVAMMAGFINPDPTLEDWFREEMGLPLAAPVQDPYAVNSNNPSGGEGDNGPDNGGDNSGDKSADNSGDKSNNSDQTSGGKSGGKDNAEEGANDSGSDASGSDGNGYSERAPANSWLLDETMDAIERGALHLASQQDDSVKLGFSIGRPRGGLGGLGGHFADGGEVMRNRLGQWEGRTAGNHSHHEAVEERGGGAGHETMRGRPRIHENDSERQKAYYEREKAAGRDPMGRKNELARARRAAEFEARQAANAHAARVAEVKGEHGGKASANMPRAALLSRIAEISPVASGHSMDDITWRGSDGQVLHPAASGMRTLNGNHISEPMRLSASRVEQEMRNSPTARIVGVSQSGQIHELGAHPTALRSADARTLAQLQGGVVLVNHPLGSAPKLSEMAAAAHVGAIQLRVVTPFYRHAISSANARQAVNADAVRHLAPLYRHTTSVVTTQVKDAIKAGEVSPWHAARQIGHVVWQRVAQPAKLHYVRAAWDEESALMRESDDESVKLFGFGGFHISGEGGSAGRPGMGGAFDSLHPRGFGGKFRFVNGGVHEHTSAQHHGDEEHGGGQGHGGKRGASEEERSVNSGSRRKSEETTAKHGSEERNPKGAHIARVDSQLGQLNKPTDAHEALTKLAGGNPERLFHILRDEPTGVTEVMAREAGIYGLRPAGRTNAGADRIARAIAEHLGMAKTAPAAKRTAGKAKGEGAAKKSLRDLTPIGAIHGHQINIAGELNPHVIRAVYGDHQVRDALRTFSPKALRGAAENVGANAGRNKEQTIENILHEVRKVPYQESVRLAAGRHGFQQLHPNRPEAERASAPKAPAAKKPAAPKAPKQTAAERNAAEIAALHVASRDWQAKNPDAPREVKPGENVTNIHPQGGRIDPLNAPSPDKLVAAYGEHQVGQAYQSLSMALLREEMAKISPGTSYGSNKSMMVSHLTAAATHGHYSANFPKESASKASKPATAKAQKPLDQMTPAELRAYAKSLEGGKSGGAKGARKAQADMRVPRAESRLRALNDPTNAHEALTKLAGGNRETLHEILRHEPTGVTQAMARNLGVKIPRMASKSFAFQADTLAKLITDKLGEGE